MLLFAKRVWHESKMVKFMDEGTDGLRRRDSLQAEKKEGLESQKSPSPSWEK